VTVLIRNYKNKGAIKSRATTDNDITLAPKQFPAASNDLIKHFSILIILAMQYSGWNIGRDRRTFPILRQPVS